MGVPECQKNRKSLKNHLKHLQTIIGSQPMCFSVDSCRLVRSPLVTYFWEIGGGAHCSIVQGPPKTLKWSRYKCEIVCLTHFAIF